MHRRKALHAVWAANMQMKFRGACPNPSVPRLSNRRLPRPCRSPTGSSACGLVPR
jgi:hypothetical protein